MQDSAITEEQLALATEWVAEQQTLILRTGHPLNTHGLSYAQKVGVAYPELIRICYVDEIPSPDNSQLEELKSAIISPATVGLTLGYGIYLKRGKESLRLVTHEFRHVQQYEAKGTISAFLHEYLNQIKKHGYARAPLELDAVAHELAE